MLNIVRSGTNDGFKKRRLKIKVLSKSYQFKSIGRAKVEIE